MARTFEELAGSEMDALYQGALFLSGGDRDDAEKLVVDAVMLAFDEHAADIGPQQTRRWFEARLVRSFLEHFVLGRETLEPRPDQGRRPSLDADTFDSLEATDLFQAAGTIPPGPRAALWLVLLRRWSYEAAARVLRVEPEQLPLLLGHRDVLMRELMRRSTIPPGEREIS